MVNYLDEASAITLAKLKIYEFTIAGFVRASMRHSVVGPARRLSFYHFYDHFSKRFLRSPASSRLKQGTIALENAGSGFSD